MEAALEAALTQLATTAEPQVLFSALDPELLITAPTAVMNAQLHQSKTVHTASIQTPLFPDLVRGLCDRLWDGFIKWGSGNPFSVFSEEDLEDDEDEEPLSQNRNVQKALQALTPLSKKGERQLDLLIDAYCTGGSLPQEVRAVGLSRPLSQQDQLDLLLVLMQSMWGPYRHPGEASSTRFCARIVLLVDEIEHVTHCAALDVAQFTRALTYFVDEMGDGFTLWLNVNDDDPSFPPEVKQALGPRFVARITHDLTG